MSPLVGDLQQPDAYPGTFGPVEFIETHISWVFLVGGDVYKVKKPVHLGFLDFRSIEQRRIACDAEVRLNARLAPGVYLGVVPVCRGLDGRYRIGTVGDPVDWAVHMKRLRDDERADNLLSSRGLGVEDIDLVAQHLAQFHASARCDAETTSFGTVPAITKNVLENFAQTRADVARFVRPAAAAEIERRQLAFLREQASTLVARMAGGRVRDGHGDLRLEHVYLSHGHPTIIDCIEFADRFRFADVCADVAFLSMDLAWHGRVDLAERFIARYAREANDFDLYSVIDFYEGYRAYVRAKVSMVLAMDGQAGETLRAAAGRDARRFLLLALSAGRQSPVTPALVCVGGLIASGKSTVAEQVSLDLSAPVVDADRTRKHMMGVAPTVHVDEGGSWRGVYDPAVTQRVYAEVLRRAGIVLASGRPVIVDASFRSRALRRAARDLATVHGVPFRFVECRTDDDVCRARLARRERESGVSDARLPLFETFRPSFEPVDELTGDEHIVIDTGRSATQIRVELREQLSGWPKGLNA
jgi:aminoglycoside phosphotransferase family enzyme/predicted kinase